LHLNGYRVDCDDEAELDTMLEWKLDRHWMVMLGDRHSWQVQMDRKVAAGLHPFTGEPVNKGLMSKGGR
jgi:hypothetical protein